MLRTTALRFAFTASGLATLGCEAGPEIQVVDPLQPTAYEFVETAAPASSVVPVMPKASPVFLPKIDPLDACAVRCRAEAMATARDCLAQGTSCPADAADVFDVCSDAECSATGRLPIVAVPARFHASPLPAEPVALETVPAAPETSACVAACEAHDLDVYVACVKSNQDRPEACRENLGRTLASCIEHHCAE